MAIIVSEKTKRGCGRPRAEVHAEPEAPASTRPNVAAFRRAPDGVYHLRCGRRLDFQGVRGHLEADFYCYGCFVHVTIPLPVLDTIPVVSEVGPTP